MERLERRVTKQARKASRRDIVNTYLLTRRIGATARALGVSELAKAVFTARRLSGLPPVWRPMSRRPG